MEEMGIRAIAQDELSPGEKIAWLGQPSPFALARKRSGMILPGLFFTMFSLSFLIVPTVGFLKEAEKIPLPVFAIFQIVGLVFLSVGLAMLSSPFWRWRKAKRTVYAVTDRRVLIVEPGRVQSFEPGDLQQLERLDKGNGRGDLIFREEQGNMMLAMYTFGNNAVRKVGFFGIPDARAAEEAVRQLKRSEA